VEIYTQQQRKTEMACQKQSPSFFHRLLQDYSNPPNNLEYQKLFYWLKVKEILSVPD